jgi:1-acyl-sn-glycerol-3-phosphate acyltransferase
MFETFFLQTLFNSPKFILKNELLKIPVFGWYLRKIGSISVQRNKISKDNLGLLDKIKDSAMNSDRPIIIFPQGTRVLPKDRAPFKKGVGRIYNELKIKCQPIAINSGTVWPKKGSLIKNKTITVAILKAIEPGLDAIEFTNLIEKKIYFELDRMV